MAICPYCEETRDQVKAGSNGSVQRYKCGHCQRRYTPETRRRGYPDALRRQAIGLAAQGVKIRQISRDLGVNHQTVANWIRQGAERSATSSGDRNEAMERTPPAHGERESTTLDAGLREAKVLRKERATIADVAERAQVSPTTISNYLNAKGRMSEETRNRIRKAMDELSFTPSALTRAIRQRRTRILGLLIFGLSNLDVNVGRSLTPPLVAGIYEAANRTGHDILLYTGWPNRPERDSGLDFLNGHIDGLLWVAPNRQIPALERLAVAGLPVVALLTRHIPEGVGYVNADNIGAMQEVVAHLARGGRRRIAYLGPVAFQGKVNSNLQDRLEGYRMGLVAVDLPYDPALEAVLDPDRWREKGYMQALDGWLRLESPPDAIAVCDDTLAGAVCAELRARGLRVPEEIAVTGFDDIPDAKHMAGGITTIRQPLREIGRLAAERLVALIEGASVEACRLTIPTQLIVRASSGPTV
jgi:LacI family transcriptional regulator